MYQHSSFSAPVLADRVGHHVSDEAAQHPQAHLPRPQQAFELPTVNSISIRLINQDLTFSCANTVEGVRPTSHDLCVTNLCVVGRRIAPKTSGRAFRDIT
jgi:hypothetical protein